MNHFSERAHRLHVLPSREKWVTSPRPITMQPETPGIEAEPGWSGKNSDGFLETPGLLGSTQVLTNGGEGSAHNRMAEPSSRGCVMLSRWPKVAPSHSREDLAGQWQGALPPECLEARDCRGSPGGPRSLRTGSQRSSLQPRCVS